VVPITAANLSNPLSDLLTPYILLINFTANNFLWESELTYERGRIGSDVCAAFNLIVLNINTDTWLCQGSRTLSNLNLSLYNPGLSVHVEWSSLPDHYPLHICVSTLSPYIQTESSEILSGWISLMYEDWIFVCWPYWRVFCLQYKLSCFLLFVSFIHQPHRIPVHWWIDACMHSMWKTWYSANAFMVLPAMFYAKLSAHCLKVLSLVFPSL
jgi:hypothetical protein